jgi:ABC-type Fe3+ transport system permease subunit
MSSSILAALLAWLLALAIFLGFIVLLRYIDHRERMALINRGFHPDHLRSSRKGAGVLRAGLIIFMVGLALTVGLYPIGFLIPPSYTIPFRAGPWLLPGLIPLGVGIALIISYYLAPDLPRPDQSPEDPQPKD